MRGLVIDSPWIEKILNGEKTWELRSSATQIRGEVALIKKGSGAVFGLANIRESRGPLTEQEMVDEFDRHQVPQEF